MNRKEFLRKSSVLGLGAAFFGSLLSSCSKEYLTTLGDFDVNFSGDVLIIGAGSAGLTAGHLLKQFGIDFQILEASGDFGGRVKQIEGFADFPIDLGAEWIHTDPGILARLLNDPQVDANIDLITYQPEEIYLWKDNKLKRRNIYTHFYSEYKFKRTTWYSFFRDYMVPGFADRIQYNNPVAEIDYTGPRVSVRTVNGDTYTADKVLVTVPLSILQQEAITFIPSLPTTKTDAINAVEFPDGIKIFVAFEEQFYPDMVYVGGLSDILASNDKTIYDAAFRKDAEQPVLGLFTAGETATPYTSLGSDEAIINYYMDELDTIFDGQASRYYQRHVVQNWSAEPFIQGSYSFHGSGYLDTISTLLEPLEQKVYFAGEAMNEDGNTSTVHGAGESSFQVVKRMLQAG